MNRRGFLRALVGAAVAPVVAQAAPLLPPPAPVVTPTVTPVDGYQSWTFKRQPGFFDVVTYYGDGERKTLPRAAFEASVIIVKCTSSVQPWYILESTELPPELNLPGETYVAYEFGEEYAEQLKPALASKNFTRI